MHVVLVLFSFNTYLTEIRVGVLEAATLLIVMALAIAVPSAPAGIGLFEAGIVAYLTQRTGVGNEAALAAASIFHLIITVPQLFLTGWLISSRRRDSQ
jgi:hypothetical protein